MHDQTTLQKLSGSSTGPTRGTRTSIAAGYSLTAAAGLLLGWLTVAPANAADLGGDCCADLEERVAELEATTVRKGNRKVSLKLSGHVNTAVFFWDDGINSDAYVVENTESETRFRLTGDAAITPDLSAGFYIELEVISASGSRVNQRIDGLPNENVDGPLTARKVAWNLNHARLGKITVGRESLATDDIILLNIAKNPVADADIDVGRDFHFVRPHGTQGCNGATCRTTLDFDTIYVNLDTNRADLVRYDSPSLLGFVFSAAWGEDDIADIAIRYKNEWNSVRMVAGIGYLWVTDETEDRSTKIIDCPPPGLGQATCVDQRVDFERLLGSASAMHVPTGLYVYGAGGWATFDFNDERVNPFPAPVTGRQVPDATMWYLQAGIKRRLLAPSLGATTLYGEYTEYNDWGVRRSSNNLGVDLTGGEITASSAAIWGFGIVQDVDPAALKLYAGFRSWDADIRVAVPETAPAGQDVPLEHFYSVLAGGKLSF